MSINPKTITEASHEEDSRYILTNKKGDTLIRVVKEDVKTDLGITDLKDRVDEGLVLKSDTPPTDTSQLWFDTRKNELFSYNITAGKWLSVGSEEIIIFKTPQAVSPDGYFELAPGIIEYLVLEESYAMSITCDKGTLVDGVLGIETNIDGAIGTFSVTDSQNLEGGDVVVTPPGTITAGSVLKLKHLGLLDIADTYIVLTLKKLAQ